MTKQYKYKKLNSFIKTAVISNICVFCVIPHVNAQTQVTSSGENVPYETALHAFDKSYDTKWLTFSEKGWISYMFDKPTLVTGYTLTSGNDAASRDPKNWQLQGTNDGINWVHLDSRTSESFSARKQSKLYSLNNILSFNQVRLNVTSNNGGSYLQLSEIQFETQNNPNTLPLFDSASLSKGIWKHYGPFDTVNSKITAKTTGSGDTDLYMRRGSKATRAHYDCIDANATSTERCELSGNDVYVSVYAYNNITYNININDPIIEPPSGDWIAPLVTFVDMNPETQGSKLVNRILQNPASHMAKRCIDVAKILYRDPLQSNRFKNLRFELRALDFQGNEFVAYKTGQDGSGEMTIAVSTTHLEKLYREGGNSDSAISDEISGILFHEVTHGYNNSPLTHDGYGDGKSYWAYTEGLADGVRIGAGFHKTRQPDVNNPKKWLAGYTTTGFFLHYVVDRIDPNFIYKFNKTAKDLTNYTWSFENAFQQVLNRSVDDVWNEYQVFINNGGKLNY
ncbi:basic secretory protein-like protein [Pseudoalteromonas denitrificans]|uniref:F5/8 type C domain-containing protein n=1 Tax=Pseudoalteromonas denitrificans DSM 6059 TaxID=1123010 RepID=A0A1I1I9N0_9GAMM|nr:basic secretory protein-like protein [Pseudoalteromonas denitrificans]SFC32735.1 F5/8 type C domain-containing protein [Pseudoalteromonas denitrificans DSM 6059]